MRVRIGLCAGLASVFLGAGCGASPEAEQAEQDAHVAPDGSFKLNKDGFGADAKSDAPDTKQPIDIHVEFKDVDAADGTPPVDSGTPWDAGDLAPQDTGAPLDVSPPADTGPQDTGSDDVAAGDTGPQDTGPGDVPPYDVGPKDGGGTGPGCQIDAQCNDEDPCTADSCVASKCHNVPTTCPCLAGPCCEAGGGYKPKGTACGASPVATTYQCAGTGKGGTIQTREAYPGCTGSAGGCSLVEANWVYGDWKDFKKCQSNQVCSLENPVKPATCESAIACASTDGCCTSGAEIAPAGTVCGSSANKTEYQCESAQKGAHLMVRKSFDTCDGKSSSCFGFTSPEQLVAWSPYWKCAGDEVCKSPSVSQPATCVKVSADACSAADPYEVGKDAATAYDLGSATDTDKALWLDPAVSLGVADVDWLSWSVADSAPASQWTGPEVYVAWEASGAVTVCVYFRCDKGVGGKDCAPVTCPWSATAVADATVSGATANGCCDSGAYGSITLTPEVDADPNDASGRAFASVHNDATKCQGVKLKRAFGGSTSTQCSPGATCCTPSGAYAKDGTPCESYSYKTEYGCSDPGKPGGAVVQRSVMGTCQSSFGYTSCSNAPENQVWGPWEVYEACAANQVCVVAKPSSAGSCELPNVGSCSGQCGGVADDGGCRCDAGCEAAGTCCGDFQSTCGGSCDGACGKVNYGTGCSCDGYCATAGDCCLDKNDKCGT